MSNLSNESPGIVQPAPADHDVNLDKLESCVKKREGGGWRTAPFIFGCEASEGLAGFGAHANLITFLTDQMHMRTLSAATLLNSLSATTTGCSLLGAFVADAHLGQFQTIALGSWIILAGLSTLTMVAWAKPLHPAECTVAQSSCEKSTSLQMGILCLAFVLMALGAALLRPCIGPFGASQFDQTHPEEKKQLTEYFNWYFFTISLSMLLASTVVVYVQDNVGWALGFGIPTIVFLLSIVFFYGGMRLYRYRPRQASPFTRMAQVMVAAFHKRNLALPQDLSTLYHGANVGGDENKELEKPSSYDEEQLMGTQSVTYDKVQLKTSDAAEPHAEATLKATTVRGGEYQRRALLLHHTYQFRFLDKAAIVKPQDWSDSYGSDGQTRMRPWRLCSVQQVEELKCMMRLAPMWLTLIPMALSLSIGGSYGVLQATTMDRRMGNFVIPAASFSIFNTITIIVWLPFFQAILVPLLRKKFGNQSGIMTFLHKIGMGTLLLILGHVVSTIVEHKRREAARHYGLQNKPKTTIPMSSFWLLPQHIIGGLSESFMIVGQLEFFYYMLPEHLTTTGSALLLTARAIGSTLNSALLHLIQNVTSKRPGRPGWLDNNINLAHLDRVYAVLTIILVLDFALFLVVAHWYKKQRNLNRIMVQSNFKRSETQAH